MGWDGNYIRMYYLTMYVCGRAGKERASERDAGYGVCMELVYNGMRYDVYIYVGEDVPIYILTCTYVLTYTHATYIHTYIDIHMHIYMQSFPPLYPRQPTH